jgi:cell division protein FtsZ
MAINLSVPQTKELKPRLMVFGVGGAGCNAVNNMISSHLEGVDFVVANTDAQALNASLCERRIQLGANLTEGLGAGMKPEIGRGAAEEATNMLAEHLQGAHMAFIAAGMGGGTGTGAAPVIARVAKEMGILTVGVVTKPFRFEGNARMRLADSGIRELQQYVDTLIIIPNQNLFVVATEKTTFADAFKMADNVLYSGVRGITDLIVKPGLINLDFADVKSVMSEMGKAMMGTGEADGERRAIDAAERAIANPLLDEVSMKGARGLLINITGGPDLTLLEVDEAANRVAQEVDPEANIITGATIDESMAGRIRVSVVATGMDREAAVEPKPSETVIRMPQRPAMPMTRPAAQVSVPASAPAMATATMRVEQPASVGNTAVAMAPMARPVQAEIAMPAVQPDLPVAQPEPVAEMPAKPERVAPAAVSDPFLPPRPVGIPKAIPSAARAPVTAADPFAEAEVVNAAPQEEKKKKVSLLERIASMSRQPAASPTAATGPERIEPAVAPPKVTATKPAPMAQPAHTRAPLLGGIEPADRPAAASQQDDLLDIPAFLRRQAN